MLLPTSPTPPETARSITSAAALAERLDDALPQTQCTRCGYPDCRAYANAIAFEGTATNQCPPGGQAGADRLANIAGRAPMPLNPDNGREGPRELALIDEDWCIGCTLCLKACPTDAIVGANKTMHSVIDAHCTGCALCVPVCPVDCIRMEPVTGAATGWQAWSPQQADTARQRYARRAQRLGLRIGTRPAPLHQRRAKPAPEATGTIVHAEAKAADGSMADRSPVARDAPGASAGANAAAAPDKAALLAAIMAKARARREQA
ncbi:RnfABCDGE type electron transport complex subunit B [Corticibacter populi]|uniref:RnfABCDGE type electron transport complex subunit B n=1 Tax=Corticibacter populi TaxID=1550736 RepID=A0A3M6QSQ5_9BURK|nr:RnfABCDGE type electron transport complex subunit B [Corticibacter populi]